LTNEEIVGAALKPGRDQVVIATKFGFASNFGVLAMNTIFNDVCVLVAAAFFSFARMKFRNKTPKSITAFAAPGSRGSR
jgi:hypothetical protein